MSRHISYCCERQAVCLILISSLLWAATSFAQYPTKDDAAKEAYQEAKQLFENEKYQEAAARFREAHELKPSWKILYNIGQSEAAAKNHGLALEAFEMFLSEGGDDIYADRREQVSAEVDRLRRMVGYVQVSAPKGAVVYINDIERGTAPIIMALPVSAGVRHRIYAMYQQKKLEEQTFRVVGAQKVAVQFDMPDIPPSAETEIAAMETNAEESPLDHVDKQVEETALKPSSAIAHDAKKNKLRLTGWILSGTGAGILVGAGVLGSIALLKNKELADDCGNYCPTKKDEDEKYHNMANASTALFIGGGAIAAAGVILLMISAKKEKQHSRRIRLNPAVSKSAFGGILEYRF